MLVNVVSFEKSWLYLNFQRSFQVLKYAIDENLYTHIVLALAEFLFDVEHGKQNVESDLI